jgi:hypothetical protein
LFKHASLSVWLAPVVFAAACATQPVPGAQAIASSADARAGDPAGAAVPVPAHEIGGDAAADGAEADVQVVRGSVVETMDASTYTYVKVSTGAGEVWAASSHFDVKVGDRVVVPLESPMRDFHSQSLNRDFPLIYFASQISREGEAAPAGTSGAQLPPGHPPVGAAPAVDGQIENIAPPEGGKSVATVWADRTALAGKTVTVRGQVVKFNGGILGRNWVHLRDGSGSAEDRTNDLTVTTDAVVKVGEVITVTGTVVVDKDFGAGYSYAVLIENGKVGGK